MNFTIDQQKAIEVRGKDTLVSASAGSGKTRVLVERLCQLIVKDHIPVDHILAMHPKTIIYLRNCRYFYH